jgi:hypothetical protein
MLVKKWLFVATVVALVGGVNPAGASPYMVEDLGAGIGYGINDFGDVAGKSFDYPSGAAVWVGGLKRPLPGNYQDTARDINNAGVVAGETHDCPMAYRAPCGVVWYGSYQPGERTYLRGLGQYAGTYAPSLVQGINNGGFVCGHSTTIWQGGYFSNPHATIWDPDGNPTDLGVWPGDEYSQGFGINDPAHVAGHSKDDGGPLLYLEAPLPDPPGGTGRYLVQIPEVTNGWVGAINNADQVVGSYCENPNYYLFKADPIKPWLLAWEIAPWNVTHIPVSGPASSRSINDAGEMVGQGPNGAFLWNAWNGMQTLADLIHPDDPLYGKITLREANDINNYGWIVAKGLYNSGGGTYRVFLLRPMSLGAAYLTTGSPVSIRQVVNTPDVAFEMKFDYRFETTTGSLTVRVDGSVLETIPAPPSLVAGLQTRTVAIGDPHLNKNVELEFKLDGETGSKVVLTNILFPGLENGRFAGELYGWTVDASGEGAVEFVELEIPEEPEELAAVIDIDPDVLNRKSEGKWITGYIELPEGHSVDDIDQSTVAISEVGGEAADIPAEHKPAKVGDYDLDGITDLMVKFPRADVADAAMDDGEVDIEVSGELADGSAFSGADRIQVMQ